VHEHKYIWPPWKYSAKQVDQRHPHMAPYLWGVRWSYLIQGLCPKEGHRSGQVNWLEFNIWLSIPRQGGYGSKLASYLEPLITCPTLQCMHIQKWQELFGSHSSNENWRPRSKRGKNSLWVGQNSQWTPWTVKNSGFKSGRMLSDLLTVLSSPTTQLQLLAHTPGNASLIQVTVLIQSALCS
jgi:hypothetical protein